MAGETQPVLQDHIRELVTVLDAAYGLSLSDDLARRYRNMHPQVRVSPLTNLLETNLERFTSYVESVRPVPEPVEDDDEQPVSP